MTQQRYARLTFDEHRAIGAAIRNFHTTVSDSLCSNKQGRLIERRRWALLRAFEQLACKLDSEMYANCDATNNHSPYYGDGLLLIGPDLRILATAEHVEEVRQRFEKEVAKKLTQRVPAKLIDLGIKVSNKFRSLKVALEDQEWDARTGISSCTPGPPATNSSMRAASGL
jgi:hypothetical protein